MNIEILQMLLDSGLDPNFGDRAGRTALHCLIRKMHYQKMFNRNEGDADQLLGAYMKTLLIYGANPNAQDVNGSTPMHSAAIYNYPGCSSVLKDYGGNVEMEDSRGMTPFLKAVEFGSFQVMQELASLGVNVHRWDKFGKTALHAMGQFARVQRMQCMKFLIGCGLDVNQQDNEGNTCLHLAARSKAPEDIIVELLQNGADANILNNLGRSPLYEYLDNEYLWTEANCSYIVLSYSPEKGSFPKTQVTPGVSSFEGLCRILDKQHEFASTTKPENFLCSSENRSPQNSPTF
ncbi:death-associated protein kinase 1-like [Ptychodera flava]|uniref:death-associated protein kinase 1-like n=1 Tax=Ptychodera flava TaxID=63121 RepID=UPI00396A11FA